MVDIRVSVWHPSPKRGHGASPRRKGSPPEECVLLGEGVCLGEGVFA